MIPILGTEFDATAIGQLIQTFAITDSLVSVAVTYTMSREALVRWRMPLWRAIVLMWVALILPVLELLLGAPPVSLTISGLQIENPLTKIAVLLWFLGVAYLLLIEFRIFNLDFIRFNKSGLSFQPFAPTKWGVPGIDQVLKSSEKVYYPIVVLADESSRPWEILQMFVACALAPDAPKDVGIVYFTFTRPPSVIYRQILNSVAPGIPKGESGIQARDAARLRIIDCYSQTAGESAQTASELDKQDNQSGARVPDERDSLPKLQRDQVIGAHPNNPHDVNKAYETALKSLKLQGCTRIRVVYDALSDFLKFTDQGLATQYLRHNMVWEDLANVESLYLMRSGTLDDVVTQYFKWFANGVLELKVKGSKAPGPKHLAASLRGPFKEPVEFDLDFDFNLLPKEDTGPRRGRQKANSK